VVPEEALVALEGLLLTPILGSIQLTALHVDAKRDQTLLCLCIRKPRMKVVVM
jgi:hypothetical protein